MEDVVSFVLKMVTLVAAVYGVPKIREELFTLTRTKLRDQYRFVREFLASTTAASHPLEVTAGFRAAFGIDQIKAHEVFYLLSLEDPEEAIRKYVAARNVVKIVPGVPDGHQAVGFLERYETSKSRNRFKRRYVAMYIVLACLAFAPALFAKSLVGPSVWPALVVVLLCLIVFLSLALVYLNKFAAILRAEELARMPLVKANYAFKRTAGRGFDVS